MSEWRVIEGDCLERLRGLEAGSVQTCITSPPYFGLRDYGTGRWEGGDEGCDHRKKNPEVDARTSTLGPRGEGLAESNTAYQHGKTFGTTCGKCGATRTDSQLGLEATPDLYVQALVGVFREVRRVLRDDGTLWLNLGDSYAGSWGAQGHRETPATLSRNQIANHPKRASHTGTIRSAGVKPKDLLGIPWMVAFALRADGWYLRSDIIWAKPNPMPESVTDRPTKSHEYLFLLSKQPRYFYDADAIREDGKDWSVGGPGTGIENTADRYGADNGGNDGLSDLAARYKDGSQAAGRNKRSVWTVATQPFPGAHFAVFPPKLIEPCVLAGTSERACGVCGGPWRRVVEREQGDQEASQRPKHLQSSKSTLSLSGNGSAEWAERGSVSRTVGWEPSCTHDPRDEGPDETLNDTGEFQGGDRATQSACVVLDPFCGAGTTGLVATRHGRGFIGIELNPEYAEMARQRIRDDAPLMNYLSEAA